MNNKLNNYLEHNILKINKPEKKYFIIKNGKLSKIIRCCLKCHFKKYWSRQ